MKLFDSHNHIYMEHFENDREDVIQRAKDSGVIGMVTSSITPESFNLVRKLHLKYPNYIYHSAGYEPAKAAWVIENEIEKQIYQHSKELVAIGEIGLDYYWVKDESHREIQRKIYRHFLELAVEFDLPVVLHTRNAEKDSINIAREYDLRKVLLHGFGGASELVKLANDLGWYISLAPQMMMRKVTKKVVKSVDIDFALLETDAPYLSPFKGRNEPAYLTYSVIVLSKAKGLEPEYTAAITTRNALNFYNLSK